MPENIDQSQIVIGMVVGQDDGAQAPDAQPRERRRDQTLAGVKGGGAQPSAGHQVVAVGKA